MILTVMALAPLLALPKFWGRRYEQRRLDPADFGVQAAELTLMTDDGLALAAWFVKADGGTTPGVILSSCPGCRVRR